jgi:hypothetical protein
MKGTSKNEDFRARVRKLRAQNRSVYNIHEDSSTVLTRLSCEKTIFRGALKMALRQQGCKIPDNMRTRREANHV